ncbi:MAG: xylose isomerase [Alphaproteobacteria bacterium]
MEKIFSIDSPVQYEGENSTSPLAYRFYDANKKIGGKSLKEHLRFAACYWHNFVWPGGDPFGGQTFERPWYHGDAMDAAKLKADYAFEFFRLLDVPFFCFHDRDVAPEGASFKESNDNLKIIGDIFAQKMEENNIKLLWGTANLFGHKRFMSGGATNPNPEVFAHGAAQIKNVMDLTHKLGGENYVLWGGREGYDTLLNTDLKREQDQLGRMLQLVVEYKHKIGFTGDILIEPKPQEPTKHQYDYDVATVFGFLQKYGLEKEVKMNLEANHATLAGHSFEHETALASALGILGSFDMNRGDPQVGWDTDQFPNSVAELVMTMYYIIQDGGLKKGGLNFDAKIRRQSIDVDDLLIGHIGGMDICARAFEAAYKMVEDKVLSNFVDERYSGWNTGFGQDILGGKLSLADLAQKVEAENIDPMPISGKQEYLENLVNRYF